MLISTIIPIGNYKIDQHNLIEIIKLSREIPVELIFVLDTDEESVIEMLEEQCQIYEADSYKIVKSAGRNPGTSRNLGILSATGDWITFCDSDDLPNFSNVVSGLLQVQTNCDVLIGSYEVENLKSGVMLKQKMPKSTKLIYQSISSQPGIWRWVVRRSFLAGLYFPELSLGEDQYFIIKILSSNPSINFSSEVFYRYRIGGRVSITSTKVNISDLVSVLHFEFAQKQFPKNYVTIKNNMIVKQIMTLLKNGNFKSKIYSIVFFIKYLFTLSPKEYFSAIKFISKTTRDSLEL